MKGLNEVVKKLPLLTWQYFKQPKDSLGVIGQCCPLLKSLKFNKIFYESKTNYFAGEDDDEAFAIAKTMHELCHLQILGNNITNDVLLAVLDGCPHLKSLDLRSAIYDSRMIM